MTNQELVDTKYKELSKEDFYLWLSSFVGIHDRHVPFKMLTLLRGNIDKKFSELKLEKIEKLNEYFTKKALNKEITWCKDHTVNALKILAKKMVENYMKGSFAK